MDNQKPTILIVDDEDKERRVISLGLKSNYNVLLAQNGKQAVELINNNRVHLILTDFNMPEMDGLELLRWAKENYKTIPVIIMTAFGSIENAVDAMKMGAHDYITKPIKIDELKAVIEKSLQFGKLLEENLSLKEKIKKYEGFNEIITINPQMKSLIELIGQVAQTPATILIEGESGTGKMLFARAVHYLSSRADNQFIEINCGAIPHDLLESELFGHERGAFTGAVNMKKGKFELANGGTLFLDEIGELPLDLQVKLLHVLENQKFTRVGGTQFITTNVRIVAATNKNLKSEVEKGNFRKDLFYRLRVVYLRIPPLRERKEDIPLLIDHFLKKYSNLSRSENLVVVEKARKILQKYDWPGNIRELENVMQQSIIFSADGRIAPENLPEEVLAAYKDESNSEEEYIPLTKDELQQEKKKRTESIIDELEYKFLIKLLNSTQGNVTRASEISGYDRRQIQNLLSKHNIDAEKFRK
ncbi:sigma-54-dependent transcriptional regulator [Melioribacteraceae bacterium 4301-Me]|uniref:sigma-54-dependent transcriptional regulator n=1 Tax=Pyranulibacter aquaticus TaxID=3163344 RepID=UPI003595045B